MNEHEWLTGTDPAEMLRWLDISLTKIVHRSRGEISPPQVSNRKLQLFACACYYGMGASVGQNAESIMGWTGPTVETLLGRGWSKGWAGDQTKPSPTERAGLLREIIGNPFRPVTLPQVYPGRLSCSSPGRGRLKVTGPPYCPWITSTVLALAQAAYDERPGQECGRCRGSGLSGTGYGQFGGGRCPDCHGIGRTEDGALDPDRLAVLADALEEAGCDNEDVLNHLRGLERCPEQGCPGSYCGAKPCSGWIPLRGPHYRGCWALDIVMGKGVV